MNTEFLYVNLINTTTSISVTTGTATASYLFNRFIKKQYQSSGDNNDATATTIDIFFDETTSVNRIVLQNINLKDFTVYYNNTATNKFTIAGAETTTSDWTGNSATNVYIWLSTTIECTSVSIVASATIVANEEKKIGALWVTTQFTDLDYMPNKTNYKPKINRKEYPHKMSDGGTALYVLDENYFVDIKMSYVSQTARDNLYNLYNDWKEFLIAPFPTGTAWDGRIFEVNWVGPFDFEAYSNNFRDDGYSGNIKLRETPK